MLQQLLTHLPINSMDFLTGGAAAACVVAALLASSFFRSVLLAVLGTFVVWTSYDGGIAGLVTLSKSIRAQLLLRPDFVLGCLAGLATAVAVMLALRQRRRGSP